MPNDVPWHARNEAISLQQAAVTSLSCRVHRSWQGDKGRYDFPKTTHFISGTFWVWIGSNIDPIRFLESFENHISISPHKPMLFRDSRSIYHSHHHCRFSGSGLRHPFVPPLYCYQISISDRVSRVPSKISIVLSTWLLQRRSPTLSRTGLSCSLRPISVTWLFVSLSKLICGKDISSNGTFHQVNTLMK